MKAILYRSNTIILPDQDYLRLDQLARRLGFCYLFSNRQENLKELQDTLLKLVVGLFSDDSLFILPDSLKETFFNGLASCIDTQALTWQKYEDLFVGGEELAALLKQEMKVSSVLAGHAIAADLEFLETLEVGERKSLRESEEDFIGYLLFSTAEEEVSLEPGKVIQTRYWLTEILTKQGEREIWKATDLSSPNQKQEVIIRFIPQNFFNTQDLLPIVRKIKGPTRLRHPQIVSPLEIDRASPYIFIVVEFLPTTPLTQLISKHPKGILFKKATPIIQQLGDILTHAHQQGVMRLDFRPSNLFYDEPNQVLKFVNLGRLEKDCYKSYETLEDKSIPEARDDIYALACIIYEVLSGKHPFQKKRITDAMIEKLTSQFSPLPIDGLRTAQFHALLQGLEFAKEKRPATVKELVEKILSQSWLEWLKKILHQASDTAVSMGIIGVGLHLWAIWVVWSTPLSAVVQQQIDPILTKAELALREGQNENATHWVGRAQSIYEERPGLMNLAKENFERLEEIQTAIGEVERATQRVKRDKEIESLVKEAEGKFTENQFDAASALAEQAKLLDDKNFRVLEIVKKIEEAKKSKLPEPSSSPPPSVGGEAPVQSPPLSTPPGPSSKTTTTKPAGKKEKKPSDNSPHSR